MHYSKKRKLKYDFSTFNKGGWEFLSFDVTAAVQQRENSTLTPVPIVFYLQFKMASLFSTDSGRVACSLDKYKAPTPPPQSPFLEAILLSRIAFFSSRMCKGLTICPWVSEDDSTAGVCYIFPFEHANDVNKLFTAISSPLY